MEQSSIKGSHPVIRAIGDAVRRLAAIDAAVFISGERGTGKEMLARELHACGANPQGPFVRVECADALYDRLERELCLIPSGGRLPPALERSCGGLLFLDDLTALPLALQDGLAAHLGLDGAGRGRIVASSAHDVAGALARERMSGCLLAHLAPVELALPALRQRRADIPVLVNHFLALYGERHGVATCRLDAEAMVYLWQYDWPGNVRELESVVERIVVLSRGHVIHSGDLPAHVRDHAGIRPMPSVPPRPAARLNGTPQLRSTL